MFFCSVKRVSFASFETCLTCVFKSKSVKKTTLFDFCVYPRRWISERLRVLSTQGHAQVWFHHFPIPGFIYLFDERVKPGKIEIFRTTTPKRAKRTYVTKEILKHSDQTWGLKMVDVVTREQKTLNITVLSCCDWYFQQRSILKKWKTKTF